MCGVLVNEALNLAGFFAAHGIWCVSDGGPLVPIGAHEQADGQRGMIRFMDEEDLERAVARGKTWLEGNPDNASHRVLIYDGYVTLGSWRTDALLVEVRSAQEPAARLSMALPYRAPDDPRGFAVFRPKFISWEGVAEPEHEAWGEAFFSGVDAHEQGARVWNDHLDESR